MKDNIVQWISKDAYKYGEKEVLDFINNFMMHQISINKEYNQWELEEELEPMRSQFCAGYCYYFAHMLKLAFNRGQVCWAAPFGHIVWVDENCTVYDIEGIYQGEALYFIPEQFLGKAINDFKHNGKENNTSTDELIKIIKNYCMHIGRKYDSSIEKYLKDEIEEEQEEEKE